MPVTPDTTESLSGGAGTTKTALVKRILIDRFKDNPATEKITGSLLASTAGAQDSLTVATGAATRCQVGDWFDAVDDGTFETLLVDAIPDTTHLTVRRARLGSTNAAHSAGVIGRLRGRAAPHSVSNAIDEALEKLYPEIYDIRHGSWDASEFDRWYKLPADVEKISGLYQRFSSSGSTVDLQQPNSFEGPRLVESSFADTKRAIRVPSVRTNAPDGKLHAVYTSKLSLASLTTPQIDLITYEVATTMLMTALASDTKPERRYMLIALPDDPTSLRTFATQAQEHRNREMKRLAEFLPNNENPKYKGLRHYFDGSGYAGGHLVRPW